MSTKPGVSFTASANAGIPLHMSAPLCTALFPQETREVVAYKSLPDSPATISVRPLSLQTDIPVIYRWISQELPGGRWLLSNNPLHELEEAYSSILESDCAQPFMGLVNGTPVCQLDIYKTRQDAISLYYEELPGDYGLHLLLAPLCVQDQIAALLKACLEYFFSFPEVARIVADVETGNDWMNGLFKKAGFQPYGKINTRYKTAHLYTCTRASLAIAATPSR